MAHEGVRQAVVQVSALLSIFGSSLTAITTLYPTKNRQKTGKKLLFWLCVCDFASSLTYFSQTFNNSSGEFCKIIALLGIFFPVASFLWTDLIGYFVYCIINHRHSFIDWYGENIKLIHGLVWGISLLTVVLVASFNAEGKQVNGSQWCWIKENPVGGTLLWQVIGGKFVEWTSCLILLPYLYASAACKLVQIQSGDRVVSEERHSQSTLDATQLRLLDNSDQAKSDEESFRFRGSSTAAAPKFGAFYGKMAAVPAMFLFARFWGSLKVLLYAVDPRVRADSFHDKSYLWLTLLQDACDPAQGFFNAIIFVFFSSDGIDSIREAIRHILYPHGIDVQASSRSKVIHTTDYCPHAGEVRERLDLHESSIDPPNHESNPADASNTAQETDRKDEDNQLKYSQILIHDSTEEGLFDRDYEDDPAEDLVPVSGSLSTKSFYNSLSDMLRHNE